uniref:Uncharacterized protein n=1 Tax=Arundo donax TaxID=35708 RepID=A0A0A8YMP6_ARUDO
MVQIAPKSIKYPKNIKTTRTSGALSSEQCLWNRYYNITKLLY